MKARGIRLALDDLARLSSRGYLKALSARALKIDAERSSAT